MQHGEVLALNHVESPDTRTDETPRARRWRGYLQARVGHCFVGSGKREMDKAPHLADFLLLHKIQWIEGLHLSRECMGNPVVSKLVIGAIPLLPASRFFQTSGAILPTPQSNPMPVTTTLLAKLLATFAFFSM